MNRARGFVGQPKCYTGRKKKRRAKQKKEKRDRGVIIGSYSKKKKKTNKVFDDQRKAKHAVLINIFKICSLFSFFISPGVSCRAQNCWQNGKPKCTLSRKRSKTEVERICGPHPGPILGLFL